MSSPVQIPLSRRAPGSAHLPSSGGSPHSGRSTAASAASSYSSAAMMRSSSSIPSTPSSLRTVETPPDEGSSPSDHRVISQARRTSLMSSSLAASEHTVINVGGPDGPARLITCVRSSQGFDWNQEIFLPSHYDHLITSDLERQRYPVHDIHLADEEALDMLPQ